MEIVKNKEIRRTLHNNEWWYVVEDVVYSLIESRDTKQYIQRMKQHDPELCKGWGQIVLSLPIETADGFQETQCANLEGIFRIIQSMPAPKPESYKQWLAKIGYERIQEIFDPESIVEHRQAAASQRRNRASESSNISGSMTNLEHIFSMLSEAATDEIALMQGPKSVDGNRTAAEKGAGIAKVAREKLDMEIGGSLLVKRAHFEDHNSWKWNK